MKKSIKSKKVFGKKEERYPKNYLYEIFENNEIINSYLNFEDFIKLVKSKFNASEIKTLRMIDFEELVIKYNYSTSEDVESYNLELIEEF